LKIGIDVESGERSFQELVNGSIKALQYLPDIEIFLIGDVQKIKDNFPELVNNKNINFYNAPEIIKMNEKPTAVLKLKKKSTVSAGMTLLKNKDIDFFFTPGNTGATVVASIMNLGMIDNAIKRPAMATFFPRIGGGETLIIDIGANPEATDYDLYINALLGISYYSILNDKKNPSIGILNMGVEMGKGSLITKKAFQLMKNIPSFIGNVEGYNIFNGTVDVVVCSGFIGNVILKSAEAMKRYFNYLLKHFLTVNFVKKGIFSLFIDKNKLYKKNKKSINSKILPKFYGAAPLLGVNGAVLVGHGMCSEAELTNAIMLANELFKKNYLEELKKSIKKLLKKD